LIVISDASPLIVLSKLRCLDFLNRLYPEILISAEVRDEIVTHGRGRPGSAEVAAASWITVRFLQDSSSLSEAASSFSLGLGEMSTILLAKELQADVLIIDEWKARRVAAASGFPVVGCAGLIEKLYVRGHIVDLRSIFRELAEISYIDAKLLNARLVRLGLDPL
jgi:uncharacterized protein